MGYKMHHTFDYLFLTLYYFFITFLIIVYFGCLFLFFFQIVIFGHN
jgi:hypothetical protein